MADDPFSSWLNDEEARKALHNEPRENVRSWLDHYEHMTHTAYGGKPVPPGARWMMNSQRLELLVASLRKLGF